MAQPQVSLNRRILRYPDNSLHYEVTATVVTPGTVLPFAELFVLSIKDPLNPKGDVLARVADPRDLRADDDGVYVRVDSADLVTISGDPFVRIANVDELTTMARDRVVAVRRGSTSYLASTISIVYDQLTTADAASRQIVDRLSKLTLDYAAATGSFVTDPAVVYTLPITTLAVEAVLTAAYVTKRDARAAAEAARDAAVAARDACRSEDAVLVSTIDALVGDVSFLQAARNYVTILADSAARTFTLNGSDPISYETLLARKVTALDAARAALAAKSASCDALARAVADADAALAAARTAETTALSGLYAACPTFNPNTV